MALILNIETSENICSVALSKDGELIAVKESSEERQHAKLLGIFIEELLKETNTDIKELDAVAVTKGPGSYTGLRIGVSTAKGICFGIDKKLIAIDTLESMAYVASEKYKNEADLLLCPMIDARRMEVYTRLYDSSLTPVSEIEAKVLDENSYDEILKEKKILFFGSGMPKFKEILNNENAIFDEEIMPSAKNIISLSEQRFNDKKFEDVAYFEPYYLKDFIAIKPKNKVF